MKIARALLLRLYSASLPRPVQDLWFLLPSTNSPTSFYHNLPRASTVLIRHHLSSLDIGGAIPASWCNNPNCETSSIFHFFTPFPFHLRRYRAIIYETASIVLNRHRWNRHWFKKIYGIFRMYMITFFPLLILSFEHELRIANIEFIVSRDRDKMKGQN